MELFSKPISKTVTVKPRLLSIQPELNDVEYQLAQFDEDGQEIPETRISQKRTLQDLPKALRDGLLNWIRSDAKATIQADAEKPENEKSELTRAFVQRGFTERA